MLGYAASSKLTAIT